MANFKYADANQIAMITIDFEEQIYSDPFAKTLHILIEKYIKLDAFYDKYNNEHGGRKAYDPATLLKLIIFSYYKGILSSRDIEWHSRHNILFRSLCCDFAPHHTTISNFVSAYPDAIESVFEQVVLVCDQKGLLGHELIAIDGCKISSNAAKEHSGTFKELTAKRDKIRKKIRYCLMEHQRLDGRRPKEKERKQRLQQEAQTLKKQNTRSRRPELTRGKFPICLALPTP